MGDNKNVCTIYNGIDYHKYANAVPVEDIRSLGGKIITNVAGFRYQKDQPTLIKAMKLIIFVLSETVNVGQSLKR